MSTHASRPHYGRPSCDGEHSERGLWIAVVQQALDDLSEPPRSLLFGAAISFFVGGGEWAKSRGLIADQLCLHANDIENGGRHAILALVEAGILPANFYRPPGITRPLLRATLPHRARQPRLPLPLLVATFPPPPLRMPRVHRAHETFDPYRKLPSERWVEPVA